MLENYEKILSQVKSAAKALREQEKNQDLPADRWLAKHFNENRKTLGSRDRRFVSAVLFSYFRHKLFFDGWLKRVAGRDLRDPVKLAKFLALMAAAKEALVNAEAFSFLWSRISDADGLNNPEELFKKIMNHEIDQKEISEEGLFSIRYSFPLWWVRRWRGMFGAEPCEKLLNAFLTKPPLVLRVNSLKSNRDEVLKMLREEAVEAEPVQTLLNGIQVKGFPGLKNTEAYTAGKLEIQSEASQAVCEKISPKPGERIWDVCAGGGGKTLAFSAAMQNEGEIVATDIRAQKLKDLKQRAKRAGAKNIKCADIQRYYKGEVEELGFDKIVIDAPCSGSGTLARSPDRKWRFLESDFEDFASQQSEILEKVLPYLKEGGELYYVTCSVDAAENEEVAKAFLAKHSQYEALPCGLVGEEHLKILPSDEVQTDGFFMAAFRKERIDPV